MEDMGIAAGRQRENKEKGKRGKCRGRDGREKEIRQLHNHNHLL